MAEEDFRLLASALRLGRFTPAEIGHDAGANANTVRSWLRRNRRYVEPDLAAAAEVPNGPGRPRKTWRVLEVAVPEMRRVLDGLYPLQARPASFDVRAAGHLRNLDRLEVQIASWRTALRVGDAEAAALEKVAAQSWARIAWQQFVALEQAGHAVAQTHLEDLARLERELGGGAPPEAKALPQVAVWLAQRIDRMLSQGAPPGFAARALRARAEVREAQWGVRLTAAAQAAPVWADEGLAEQAAVDPEIMQLCALVAEAVPMRRRLQELTLALQRGPAGICDAPEHGQAVLVGLARQQRLPSEEVRDWLWFLRGSHDWRDEMAPGVVLSLARASRMHWGDLAVNMVLPLREAVRVARDWRWERGALRQEALEYADRFVRACPQPAGRRIERRQLAAFGDSLARQPWSSSQPALAAAP